MADVRDVPAPEQLPQLLMAAVEQAADAVELTDGQMRIVYVNKAWEELTGYQLADALGKTPDELIGSGARAPARAAGGLQLGQSRAHWRCQVALQCRDGSLTETEAVISSLRNSDGVVSGHLVIRRSVGARLDVQRAFEERAAYHRLLLDSIADALFVHDMCGQFVQVNERACTSLGYSRALLLSKKVADIEQELAPDSPWLKLEPGVARTAVGRHRRKDGSEFPVEVRLSRFELEGKPLILCLARDMSEHRRVEQLRDF